MQQLTKDEYNVLITRVPLPSRLRRELRFIPEEVADWQDRDFLVVTNRSRSEGVIITAFEKQYVVPFRLYPRTAGASGRIEAVICDFCATWQRGTHTAAIRFQKQKSSVSFLVCADLRCSLHVRDKTPEAALSRTQLRENISTEQRIERLKRHLQAILRDSEQ